MLPSVPWEGRDCKGGGDSWCQFTADPGPSCQQQMFSASSSWALWWAMLSSPTPSIQSNLYLQNISATNSINSPNFWHFRLCQLMGMRCPRFTRSPAESCLKLSRFENSILEADKNSARFHTVPVEAGGTDGSLQAA